MRFTTAAAAATLLAVAPFASGVPLSVALEMRAQVVSGNEVTGTKCLDTTAYVVPSARSFIPSLTSFRKLDTHSTNVAILSICGGIAGSIEFCGGNPATTTGQSGTSLFTLNPTDAGATINISKGRWERCIKAAQITCPTGTFQSTCIGGATTGNVNFSLTEAA